MRSDAARPHWERLLCETADLRELSRRLCAHDPSRADDLVHDTLLTALAASPARQWDIRTWLKGVARHLALSARRADSRRRKRELAAFRFAASTEPIDAIAQAELIERVLVELRALGEPYRATIMMRYFEHLDHATIATRRGVAAATVRSWLRRGLVMMRRRLAVKDDRRDHGMALIPIWFGRLLKRSPVIGSGTIAVGLLVATMVARSSEPAHDDGYLSMAANQIAPSMTSVDRAAHERDAAAARAVSREPVTPASTTSQPGGPSMRGRLVGLAPSIPWRTPLRLRTRDARDGSVLERDVAVDADGWFRIDVSALTDASRATIEVEADDPYYMPRRADIEVAAEWHLLVSPAAVVIGSVVDANARPVPLARVRAHAEHDLDLVAMPPLTCTDDHGAYRLRVPADGPGAVVVAADDWCGGASSVAFVLGQVTTVDPIRLASGVTIEGSARVPFAVLRVCAQNPEPHEPSERRVMTDASGHFAVRGLMPGPYRIGIAAHRDLVVHPWVAEASAAITTIDAPAVDAVLDARATLVTFVANTNGVPAVEAHVSVIAQRRGLRATPCDIGATDRDGRVSAYLMPGCTYECSVQKSGHRLAPAHFAIAADATQLLERVDLEREIEIAPCRVALLANGTRYTGPAWFRCEPMEVAAGAKQFALDPIDGIYCIDDLAPGAYRIAARAGADARGRFGTFLEASASVVLDGRVTRRDITLQPGGLLNVNVVDREGRSRACQCTLRDDTGNPIAMDWSWIAEPMPPQFPASGWYGNTTLRAGEYLVQVAVDGRTTTHSVHIAPPMISLLTIER